MSAMHNSLDLVTCERCRRSVAIGAAVQKDGRWRCNDCAANKPYYTVDALGQRRRVEPPPEPSR